MNLQPFLVGILTVVLFAQLACMHPTVSLLSTNYGILESKDILPFNVASDDLETARFVFAKTKPSSVVFVGDVMLARNVEFLMMRKDNDYPFKGFDLRGFSADPYVIGNFESSIPKKHEPTSAGEMRFSVSSQYLSSLRDAGFTHLSVANNHTLDHGKDGLLNTRTELVKAGLDSFGDPSDLTEDFITYLEFKHKVVALVGIHALEETPTARQLRDVFTAATRNSDMQIAYIHWGTEYRTENDAPQRRIAKDLVAAGADLVVGHHPHVVENVDLIDGVPIFYSLGNYIFDQYLTEDTERGLVLSLEFSDEPVISLIPVTSQGSPSQPQRMSVSEHGRFLSDLARKSHPSLKNYIEHGVIPLNSLVATSSKIAMMD